MLIVRALRTATMLLALGVIVSGPLSAQQKKPASTLFENVRIFNGTDSELSPPSNVLVRGNVIEAISTDPIATDKSVRTTVIAGNGRTLMPGLIDAHVHIIMSSIPLMVMMRADPNYITLVSGQAAEGMLMRGFTSVRDLAGPTFGLKLAIDRGVISGPRIWPSGAMITQTSGHGDYRTVYDIPRGNNDSLHFTEQRGFSAIADGRAEVLRRVREQLMQGASQIKLAAGGGVASDYDPLDVSQYTEDELRAAVEAAEDWGTYVTVHAYTPDAVKTAIKAGVKVIDHGQLLDDETVRMMAKQAIWWSMQPFLDDEDSVPFPEGSANRAKQIEMTTGTDTAYKLAKKHGVKLAWGTDTLFDPQLATRQGAQLVKMKRWFEPAEILKMATYDNAQLLALSGNRSPYKGKLGVVEVGALADLLLIEGDPLADIDLIGDSENMAVIMKDGRIFKNADAE
ncbi:imidazolonepropionase-like amidohydrolase [Tamilnaduibacter salinus]|uniref:Imidazolonepropionase-like amidohydrolase n=1 Tax=Tamilnaduibacter salinus TaxID=1484056 RepID=A0A2U1D0F3_9GAMM|nr:amidohydrolase family protein [Tamilnaduibacter salinus]PVY78441.1 imidazolonepropionase-like amidohydrolase [Tamilnaduibacter salinus]